MKKETIKQREARANKLKSKLISKFCKYHKIPRDNEMRGDLDYILTAMRNELITPVEYIKKKIT